MIEFFEVMFRALTGLRLNMPNIIMILVFFGSGYLFAKFAKNIGMLKALAILIVGYFIATILSALLGVFSLAFVLGFLSHQSRFIYNVLSWAESLSEIYYSLQHQAIFEDIQSRESELEAEIKRLREKLREQQQQQSSSEQRKKAERKSSSQEKTKQSGSNRAGQSSRSHKQVEIDRCLKVLDLAVGKRYTHKEIKKAYRKLSMIHHPDMPNGSHEAFVKLGEAMEYLLKNTD